VQSSSLEERYIAASLDFLRAQALFCKTVARAQAPLPWVGLLALGHVSRGPLLGRPAARAAASTRAAAGRWVAWLPLALFFYKAIS
jgi:hypothetical protein